MTTPACFENIARASLLFQEADAVLIGAGAGLSASGGLDYTDPALFARWFPELHVRGLTTIAEAVSHYWRATGANRLSFWAYWARHIQRIRYDAPATKPYLDLFELVRDKRHFVMTTNVDAQFVKAGFRARDVFAPQGDYALFQCRRPCTQAVYDNHAMVDAMIRGTDSTEFTIRDEDVPHCPVCGDFMERNLRIDDAFVEAPHLANREALTNFLSECSGGRLLLLELGVGFNTPVIIRWPFEQMAATWDNAALVRVNSAQADVTGPAATRGVSLQCDTGLAVENLRSTATGPGLS